MKLLHVLLLLIALLSIVSSLPAQNTRGGRVVGRNSRMRQERKKEEEEDVVNLLKADKYKDAKLTDPRLKLYEVADCKGKKESPAHQAKWTQSIINRSIAGMKGGRRVVSGRFVVLDNPLAHFSVIESSGGGCAAHAIEKVSVTAAEHNCHFATNGGFMISSSSTCLGHLVSGCKFVHRNATQNAHFGITKDGRFVTGYIPEEMAEADVFSSLVGGVIWMVKDGKNFVRQAMKIEDIGTQETGGLGTFTHIVAPRTAIGHDKHGRLMLIVISGNSRDAEGINLFELADFAIAKGMVNGINLDGGGSTAAAENGVLTTFPSDVCAYPSEYVCEGPITTITCVHDGTDVCSFNSGTGSVENVTVVGSDRDYSDGGGFGVYYYVIIAVWVVLVGVLVYVYMERRGRISNRNRLRKRLVV